MSIARPPPIMLVMLLRVVLKQNYCEDITYVDATLALDVDTTKLKTGAWRIIVMGNGFIKISKKTGGHLATLKALGYNVEEKFGQIVVEHQGVVDRLEATDDTLKQVVVDAVIKQKKVLSYKSKLVLNGKELQTLPMLTKLGVLSALVMHVEGFGGKGDSKPKESVDDILKLL